MVTRYEKVCPAERFVHTGALTSFRSGYWDTIDAQGIPRMQDLSSRTFGRYHILSKIGEGGMGEVYRAHDQRLDREVAIKVLPEEVASDPDRLKRFEREVRAVASLNHPNILAIHDFGTDDDVSYAVMELLDGETLREVISRGGVTPTKAVEYARTIADGLAAAHDKDIVHRDLKPDNVFLTRSGHIKILDFGLAKLQREQQDLTTESPTATLETSTGVLMGTVPYMSPEQVRGDACDQRTDIFALGTMLYEMLCGQRPFAGNSMMEVASSILSKDPEPISSVAPDVAPALANVVMRCLEKRPDDRFSSARDLSMTLGAMDSGPSTVAPQEKSVIEKRWPHILAVVIATVIALLVIFPPEALFDRLGDAPSTSPIRSIAVLPLDNLSGDPGQEYFADGMTEALIADLAKIRALKVISRTSVMRYKGTTTPLPEIAAELGVDAVVEGSVMRAGDRVRITAQLIEAATDQHLWAENYERDMTDILSLQGEVARAIAREIRIALTPQEEERLTITEAVDPESYEAYLMGQYQLKKETVEGARAALPHFEEAIARDPDNALAYAGLAEVYGGWGRIFGSAEEAEAKAEAAALKALELDDTLAEAHFALAYVKFYAQWDWQAAGREFERALELNPNLSEAHHNYAHLLWTVGRSEEGEFENLRYIELDPQWPRPYECMGFHLGIARQYERAVGYFLQGLEIDPTYYYGYTGLGDAYVQLGNLEEAAAAYRTALGLSEDPMSLAALGLAYVEAISGNGSGARQTLDRLEAKGAGVSSVFVTAVYGALGDRDEAFVWLERGFREKDVNMILIRRHPWLDPLRGDPRFDDIVRRMNFPEN